MTSTLNKYKADAGRIADAIQTSYCQHGATPYGATSGVVALILEKKSTKGCRAALLCGLVVGALMERSAQYKGLADCAAALLAYMATLIDEGKQ